MKKNETVFDRCVAAYFRHCRQYHRADPGTYSVPQPSRYDSEVDGFSVSRIK